MEVKESNHNSLKSMKGKKSNKGLIGATGEYYVCAELGKKGLLPLLTAHNNPLFDIVTVAPDASKTVYIQVKTMSENNKEGWKFGMDICEPKENSLLFVVLVNIKQEDVEYYIYEYDVLSERVRELYEDYMNQPKKDGGKKKDVGFRWFDFKYFTDEDKSRKNNWDLLKFE
jgi:hypothetical protein